MKFSLIVLSFLLASCVGGSPDKDTDDGSGGSGGSVTADFFVSVDGDDAADGSASAPWRHIQYAIDRLQPGQTLSVQPGIYRETLKLSAGHSGNEQARIEILAQAGAILDGSAIQPRDVQALIEIDGAAWLRISGFELRNLSTAEGYAIPDTPIGLWIHNGAHDLLIEQLDIHDIANRSTCALDDGCGQGANGIAVYGDTTTPLRNLRFVGNRVHDNILASSEAFTLNGNVDGFELIDNEVFDNNNIAFDFIGYETDTCPACSEEQNRVRNGIVRGNRAWNNSSVGNPAYGNASEGSAGGFYVDGGRNILFDGNVSRGNDIGFEFASEHAGKASELLLMINNLVHENRQAGLSLGGYAASDSGEGGGHARDIRIYNNSFYHNRGWGSEITLAYRVWEVVFANNIIQGEGAFDSLLDQQNNGDYRLTWGRNLWWAEQGGNPGDLPTGQDSGDPLFGDPSHGDFTPGAGSPAIDAGEIPEAWAGWNEDFWQDRLSAGVMPVVADKDILGQPRIAGSAIDLGSVERQ